MAFLTADGLQLPRNAAGSADVNQLIASNIPKAFGRVYVGTAAGAQVIQSQSFNLSAATKDSATVLRVIMAWPMHNQIYTVVGQAFRDNGVGVLSGCPIQVSAYPDPGDGTFTQFLVEAFYTSDGSQVDFNAQATSPGTSIPIAHPVISLTVYGNQDPP
jgi:hypothetical protein